MHSWWVYFAAAILAVVLCISIAVSWKCIYDKIMNELEDRKMHEKERDQ